MRHAVELRSSSPGFLRASPFGEVVEVRGLHAAHALQDGASQFRGKAPCATQSNSILHPLDFCVLRLRRSGGGKGIRTPGLLIANETLYQLSYTPFSERRRINAQSSLGVKRHTAILSQNLRVIAILAGRMRQSTNRRSNDSVMDPFTISPT